jgi:predicted RNA-binding Zn-ribbon protein involved in translation (DUF1610 family)
MEEWKRLDRQMRVMMADVVLEELFDYAEPEFEFKSYPSPPITFGRFQGESTMPTKVCPACKSSNITLVAGGSRLATDYECNDCKSRFADPEIANEPTQEEDVVRDEDPGPRARGRKTKAAG